MSADRRIAAGLFVLAFVAYAWFFGGGGWNQNAHFDLTRALVERQTLHIDGYRFNTGDISWSRPKGEWHAYSNKPPGLPLLAAIPYAAIHAIEKSMNVSLDSWQVMTVNVWLLTLVTCAIPGALIPSILYFYARRSGAAPHWSLFAALATAFGTIVFPYATVFYAPVPAALFLLLAFVWRDQRPLLAGAAAGISVMCFYVAAFAVAVIAIDLLLRARKRALRFLAGGLPFAIFLGVYHALCFGAPWRTSLATPNSFQQKGLLLGFFRLPAAEALWGLTLSEYRGLFFVSPVLLLALIGLARMKRREAAMIATVALLFLAVIASFSGWEAGFAFGPRHLLPMLPLFALPLAFLRGRPLAVISILLLIASASMQFIAAAVDVQPDAKIRRPVRDYLLPVFDDGHVGVNQQSVDELLPHAQHPPGSRESTWAAFNLGELIAGPNERASVLPIALWIVAGSLLLGRWARTSHRIAAHA